MVDDQHETYTVEVLTGIKVNHENWVAKNLIEGEILQIKLRRIRENIVGQRDHGSVFAGPVGWVTINQGVALSGSDTHHRDLQKLSPDHYAREPNGREALYITNEGAAADEVRIVLVD